jgi:hypothetical protein
LDKDENNVARFFEGNLPPTLRNNQRRRRPLETESRKRLIRYTTENLALGFQLCALWLATEIYYGRMAFTGLISNFVVLS